MSRIYKHNHYPSELTMDNVNSLDQMIEENRKRGYTYDD